ncbi:hypothetical protein N8878_00990 [Psychromonas sp.]|nr:hypothetical protein [Psychromonas sp.]
MSIINNMHKDLGESGHVQPVLSGLPNKNAKQKALLISAIVFLMVCAIILVSIIFSDSKNDKEMEIVRDSINKHLMPETDTSFDVAEIKVVPPKQTYQVLAMEEKLTESISLDNSLASESLPELIDTPKKAVIKKETPKVAVKTIVNSTSKSIETVQSFPIPSEESIIENEVEYSTSESVKKQNAASNELKSGHLNIETAQLTNEQVANIYLKEASKAEGKGDNDLAAEKWEKALNVKPDLNEIRKSLAMYYYSQDDVDKTISLLKKGVLLSPDYPDFSLMLSRIALKADDPQKAYLYLEQNPPQVEGNLDYYVSYAILAQKFQQYERSEILYTSLLTQRPNNGRWLMSLAIAQDKQEKTSAAIVSYEKALKQTDLSSKAKEYINKRLAFLSKE